ncbi:pyruvoyl-dependent arginine decarboxylase [Haloparvum sedimenti]|uniref:pyruvoyl-dependent arginine decarboxylase n=1 Tax=Haloparvum sedimenti TaxID=1678448 RepID=UPI00071E9591|nr:pyruvoyl-dependent arginine decarboxylase [Haloparvum sedimenti]
MNAIHVAAGTGVAPTEMASYDAALADANLHNYNLVSVSSVVPAEATVEAVDRAPDLGPAGNRLTVVEARRTVGPEGASFRQGDVAGAAEGDGSERAGAADADSATDAAGSDSDAIVAGLGWATGPGPGLFYEVTGTDAEDVRERIDAGLDAGAELRDWTLDDRERLVETASPTPGAYTTTVVVAAYGESEPVL